LLKHPTYVFVQISFESFTASESRLYSILRTLHQAEIQYHTNPSSHVVGNDRFRRLRSSQGHTHVPRPSSWRCLTSNAR
jgi:hypothetical protein